MTNSKDLAPGILKAQYQLVNERIRQVYFTIDALRDKIHQTEEELADSVFKQFP